jgi:hypothetical protein
MRIRDRSTTTYFALDLTWFGNVNLCVRNCILRISSAPNTADSIPCRLNCKDSAESSLKCLTLGERTTLSSIQGERDVRRN